MAQELAKQYDPKDVEERIYKKWLEGRYFHAKCEMDKPTYTIVIPPPNITGQLHMGHALDNTLQDIPVNSHSHIACSTPAFTAFTKSISIVCPPYIKIGV